MAYNHDKGWCWYNTNNKINFIAVPKNASTSIRNGLNLKSMDNYFNVTEDFKSEYKNCGDIIPFFWMPKYVNTTDSSARTLALYNTVSENAKNLS